MNTRAALLLTLAAMACSTLPEPVAPQDGVIRVVSGDAVHPLLRYRDGQLSQNTSCVIQLDNPLNPRIPPMYVNGRPLGFC